MGGGRESFFPPLFLLLHVSFPGERSTLFCLCLFGKLMKAKGNASARALYEKDVPAYYYRPQDNDCP